MKYLRSNKGYALLLAVGVIVIMSVIGLSLITLSSSGIAKNQSREGIAQSSDLSEKGIEYMIKSINIELEKYISDLKNGNTTIDTVFQNFYSNYGCDSDTDIEIDGSIGKTNVCIESIETREIAKENNRGNTRLVVFKSIGTAENGKQATYRSEVEMGYSDIPEQLSYAVSSNEDGNIYLFGGTEIRGNIKVDGHLYVNKNAFWSSTTSPTWVSSVYPKILSQKAGQKANIYSPNNSIRVFTNNPTTLENNKDSIYAENKYSENNKIKENTPFSTYTTKYTDLSRYFLGESPVIKSPIDNSVKIDINTKFDEMKTTSPSTLNGEFNNLSKPNNTAGYILEENKVLYIKHIYKKNINNKNELAKDKNGNYIVETAGNMKIGNFVNGYPSKYDTYLNNPANYNNYKLSGNYYIDGDLKISGAKLEANAVLYVAGDVELEYSTVQPLNGGTLFIFANGDIKINNISSDSDPGKGSIINGYFYSNENFIMYGVGSNTTITGGVSAKNITFTALRGNAVNKGTDTEYNSTAVYNELSCTKNALTENNSAYEIYKKADASTKTLINQWLTALQNRVNETNGFSYDFKIGSTKYKYANTINFGYNSDIKISEMQSLIKLVEKPSEFKLYPKFVTLDDLNSYAYIYKNNSWTTNQQLITLTDFKNAEIISYNKISNTTNLNLLSDFINNWSTLKSTAKSFKYVHDKKKITVQNFTLTDAQWNQIKTLLDQLYQSEKGSITISVDNNCKNNIISNRANYTPNVLTGSKASDSETNQKNNPSRLTIIYDKDLVNKYRSTISDDTSAIINLEVMKAKILSLKPLD